MVEHASPYVYKFYPACSGNDPNAPLDDNCRFAQLACPPGEYLFFQYRAPAANGVPTGDYTQVGRQCIGSAEPIDPTDPAAVAAAQPVIPGMTEEDFQSLPLPAGVSNVQPAGGDVLVTVPTNVYAHAEPVTLDTQLLGFPVQVRATPVSYSWDFGDGTVVGPTDDPGAPYPALRNSHAYATAGHYGITLTTHYRGEYSVAGGPFLPVPGEAEIASPTVAVTAHTGRNELVADPVG